MEEEILEFIRENDTVNYGEVYQKFSGKLPGEVSIDSVETKDVDNPKEIIKLRDSIDSAIRTLIQEGEIETKKGGGVYTSVG